jgi:hypothetical protein
MKLEARRPATAGDPAFTLASRFPPNFRTEAQSQLPDIFFADTDGTVLPACQTADSFSVL